MEKASCHESHLSSCSENKKLQSSEEVKDSMDWLPSGWILEIRTQNAGAYAGRQIKCYYDPSTGSRFYSKKAVFRHLNPGKICGPIMRQTRSAAAKSVSECCNETNREENMHTKSNALVEDAPTGLPEGWTKEIRVRKGDRRRKDLFYIDPVSGYAFRSIKDAFRYIETGDILQCVLRPQKRDNSGTCTIEKESHSPTAAKKGGWRGDSVKKCLFTSKGLDTDVKKLNETYQSPESSSSPQWDHASTTSKGLDTDVKKLNETYQSPESSSSPQWDHASTTSEEEDLNCKIPNNKILDNKNQGVLKLMSTPDLTRGVRSPEQMLFLEKVNISCLQNEAAKTSEEALQAEQPHLNDECFGSVTNEKKHAHVNFTDLEPLAEEKESNPTPNALLASSNFVFNKEPSEHKNDKPSDTKKPKRGRKKKMDQAITMPVRASKRLAALRVNASKESEMDGGNSVEPEINASKESEMDGGNSVEPEMDKALGSSGISPLINANSSASKPEHPEKLENLEPVSKGSHSQEQVELGTLNNDKDPIFTSPFGDSWPDPCIEFAFKTLMSDIPFLDDLTTMQHCFQHQQMGSTPGPSLDHSLGNVNQGSLNRSEHLIQLNPWREPFVPFTDDARPRSIEQGLQSCKKVN